MEQFNAVFGAIAVSGLLSMVWVLVHYSRSCDIDYINAQEKKRLHARWMTRAKALLIGVNLDEE